MKGCWFLILTAPVACAFCPLPSLLLALRDPASATSRACCWPRTTGQRVWQMSALARGDFAGSARRLTIEDSAACAQWLAPASLCSGAAVQLMWRVSRDGGRVLIDEAWYVDAWPPRALLAIDTRARNRFHCCLYAEAEESAYRLVALLERDKKLRFDDAERPVMFAALEDSLLPCIERYECCQHFLWRLAKEKCR